MMLPNKRTVRFCEERNQVCAAHHILDCPHDEDLLWYSSEYVHVQRRMARDLARYWREAGYDVLLCDSFESHETQRACSFRQNYLNDYCRLGFLRGLERRGLSRQVQYARWDCKDAALDAVLRFHALGADADAIAEIYRALSESAMVFARRLGLADEYAVEKQRNHQHLPTLYHAAQSTKKTAPPVMNYSIHRDTQQYNKKPKIESDDQNCRRDAVMSPALRTSVEPPCPKLYCAQMA